jgi:hypothetical protein
MEEDMQGLWVVEDHMPLEVLLEKKCVVVNSC